MTPDTHEITSEQYRQLLAGSVLPVRFRVLVAQTDLLIAAHADCSQEAYASVRALRADIIDYAQKHPRFFDSLVPLPDDPSAPPIVRDMLKAAGKAGVGPMAAVAGAIARHVGLALLPLSPEVIVENGGDVFMRADTPQIFCVLAESADLPSLKIRVAEVTPGQGIGVCTSSGRLGHSLSFGQADAVTIMAEDVSLADALATAMANRVRNAEDISSVLRAALELGALGVLIIVDGKIGAAGMMRLHEESG